MLEVGMIIDFLLTCAIIILKHYTVLCHHPTEDVLNVRIALFQPLLLLLVLDRAHPLKQLVLARLVI